MKQFNRGRSGKEADIISLDATAINVAPLNSVPDAVVSLMERSNVEPVIVAGTVRKWKGLLLDVNLARLRMQLEDSRDYLFSAAGIAQDVFRRENEQGGGKRAFPVRVTDIPRSRGCAIHERNEMMPA